MNKELYDESWIPWAEEGSFIKDYFSKIKELVDDDTKKVMIYLDKFNNNKKPESPTRTLCKKYNENNELLYISSSTKDKVDTAITMCTGKGFIDESPSEFNKDGKYINIIIVHHNDLDGMASGSILYNTFSSSLENVYTDDISNHILTIKYSYRDLDNLLSKIHDFKSPYKTYVILIDLSITKEVFDSIYKENVDMIWLDHHQSSIDTVIINKIFNCNYPKLKYLIDTRYSATYLGYWVIKTWLNKFTYNTSFNPKLYLAALVSVYDTHKIKLFPKTMQISQYLTNIVKELPMTHVTDYFWYDLWNNEPESQIMTIGKTLRHSFIESVYAAHSLLPEFFSLSFISRDTYMSNDTPTSIFPISILTSYGNSDKFIPHNDMLKYGVGVLIRFKQDKGKNCIMISAYSDIYDINLIPVFSKYFNGGGHQKASGGNIDLETLFKTIDNDYIFNNIYTNSTTINENNINYGRNANSIFYTKQYGTNKTEKIRIKICQYISYCIIKEYTKDNDYSILKCVLSSELTKSIKKDFNIPNKIITKLEKFSCKF